MTAYLSNVLLNHIHVDSIFMKVKCRSVNNQIRVVLSPELHLTLFVTSFLHRDMCISFKWTVCIYTMTPPFENLSGLNHKQHKNERSLWCIVVFSDRSLITVQTMCQNKIAQHRG